MPFVHVVQCNRVENAHPDILLSVASVTCWTCSSLCERDSSNIRVITHSVAMCTWVELWCAHISTTRPIISEIARIEHDTAEFLSRWSSTLQRVCFRFPYVVEYHGTWPLALGHELVRLECVAVHMDHPRLDVIGNFPFDRAAALIPLLWYILF